MTAGREIVFAGAEGNRLVATAFGGTGRPVLLLHGGGQTRHAFAGAARTLARHGFRAVTLDQRGHGDSAWVESRRYRFADFAQDAAVVAGQLAAAGQGAPVLVGASLGGIAGMLTRETHPDLFAAYVFVDIVPRMLPSGVDKVLAFMRSHAEDGFARVEDAADAIAAYLPHRPRPTSLEGLRKNLRLGADGRWRWHWDPAFMSEETGPDLPTEAFSSRLEAALTGVEAPVLLVRGASSELVPPQAAQRLVAVVPQTEVVDVGGARHMVAGDRNDVFAAAIVAFLDRHFG